MQNVLYFKCIPKSWIYLFDSTLHGISIVFYHISIWELVRDDSKTSNLQKLSIKCNGGVSMLSWRCIALLQQDICNEVRYTNVNLELHILLSTSFKMTRCGDVMIWLDIKLNMLQRNYECTNYCQDMIMSHVHNVPDDVKNCFMFTGDNSHQVGMC